MSDKLDKLDKEELFITKSVEFNPRHRSKKIPDSVFNNDITFQILDWYTPPLKFKKKQKSKSNKGKKSDESTDTPEDQFEDELEETDDDSEKEDDDDEVSDMEYIIRVFGITKEKQSVHMQIKNFPPFFYIKLPEEWESNVSKNVTKLINSLSSMIEEKKPNNLKSYKIIQKNDLDGFSNEKEFYFLRLIFHDYYTFIGYRAILRNRIKISSLNKYYRFKLYESNAEPLLRFMHVQDVNSCGWITVPHKKYTRNISSPMKKSKCQIDICTNWKNVKPIECDDINSFNILSFDIEADSSHGDFPLPIKDYLKLAREIVEHLFDTIELSGPNAKKKFNLTLFKEDEIEEIYKLHESEELSYLGGSVSKDAEICFLTLLQNTGLTKKYIKRLVTSAYRNLGMFKLFEDKDENTYPISVVYTKLEEKPETYSITTVSNKIYNYFIKNNYESSQSTRNDGRGRAVGYINSILSGSKKIPGILPPLKGDRTIQIGSVVKEYGAKTEEWLIKHMITLKSCNEIDGTEVVSFPVKKKSKIDPLDEAERKVLLEWTKLINEVDPDIIVGYNIIGFDMKFMYQRAQELDCLNEFCQLSKMKGTHKELVYKCLESKAYGKNEMFYFEMHGRIILDLLQVIKKGYNLLSYKLDHVSSEFIKDKILAIQTVPKDETDSLVLVAKEALEVSQDIYKDKEITEEQYISRVFTKTTIGLQLGNYLTFMIDNGIFNEKYRDGKKFRILKIEENKYVDVIGDLSDIDNTSISSKKLKISWGLAKDDVSPKDIFRLQKGSAEDRKTIAVYCIQDCILVMLLMEKLLIIPNNMCLATVSSVPLSWILMRGQGIRGHSLVLKYCRKEGYLVPEIRPYREEKVSEQFLKFNKFAKCSVCTNKYKKGEMTITLSCGDKFHLDCYKLWKNQIPLVLLSIVMNY